MFFRRYMFGSMPLTVWARTPFQADVTAAFHEACLRQPVRIRG